ncbi:DUF454 family protein [Kroppenstedtia pulmonis]|uniref:DUF454 family protein n=1 Tax=Kroppenstedtia pulmonis TaxID=1380685 RepID=A0A7D4C7C5_9BACL|nr:PGPGW domain-containing protein [Kroppenstedtia pulmonis]QKG84896.1 DUF454 family protein [Kroppenstedtia pulmonis]
MKKTIKYIGLQVIGWLFIVLGILGLFLPILQGIAFLIIGMLILSRTSPWAKRLIKRMEKRYPSLSKQMNKIRKHPRWKRLLPDD